MRYRQSFQRGVRIGRRFRIDGAVPFAELENYTFEFSDSWEMEELGDGEEPYLFLSGGWQDAHALHGSGAGLSAADPEDGAMLKELNVFYRQVLMIVGTDPDPYRDYMLGTTIPDFEKGCGSTRKTCALFSKNSMRAALKRAEASLRLRRSQIPSPVS